MTNLYVAFAVYIIVACISLEGILEGSRVAAVVFGIAIGMILNTTISLL